MARFEGIKQDDRGIAHDMGPTIAWIRDTSGNIVGILQAEAAVSDSREPAAASTSR
jgi:hypothetical protein